MSARVTILGCGTSGGVPQLYSGWGNCDPQEPKNRRSRCSILIETQQGSILVDTTPDCSRQLENRDIQSIKALIYTHTHADHCHGIDETRWICQASNNALQTYSFQPFLDDLHQRFGYAWAPMREGSTFFYKPMLIPNCVKANQPFSCVDMEILPIKLNHGFSDVMGFRIGDFAYCTDVVTLSEENFQALEGIKYWVVDSLRHKPHPTHAHLERTLEWIKRIQPNQAYLTHMNGDMDYHQLCTELPDGVKPAYDGLQFAINLS